MVVGCGKEDSPVVGVPVAAEHGPVVGGEHPLVAVRPPDVPQLHVPVLKGGREGEVLLHTELDVPHALRLTWGQQGTGQPSQYYNAPCAALLTAYDQWLLGSTSRSDPDTTVLLRLKYHVSSIL